MITKGFVTNTILTRGFGYNIFKMTKIYLMYKGSSAITMFKKIVGTVWQ